MASVFALTDTLLVIAHTRLELLANELEGERAALLSWLVLTQVMLFCLGVGVVLASILLVLALGEAYRLPALAVLTVVFIGTGVVAGWYAYRSIKNKPKLFAASLAELQSDRSRPETPL
ncbi:phage holin family protein [Haliea sp. E1-2-M8]|uniref:phage holin family protein n=1 Tax=Haliea sp. E1-2-M8 TaxID=3064706 RepID=UPI0027255384|nr:phage holin family protein [Haliea sp. E1-2-M8]MDO8862105.1 phage holin family protein [Haliea sp. E1-2-M8]